MVPAVLAGIATKLAGMGVAAKAGIGLGIATVATAGVAAVLPVVVPDASGGATAPVEVQLPSVPNANADLGLSTAADAAGAQPGAGAQTGSAVSTRKRSPPTIVTSAGTSGARCRMRTDASKRSVRASPAVNRAPSTVKVRCATSVRRPITTVFVTGCTSRT